MKAHIVLAHPEPQSFNGHLADTSQRVLEASGWQTTVSDLYAMDFDPCEGPRHYGSRKDAARFHAQTEQRFSADSGTMPTDVSAEVERLLACDLLVVHFPLWWFGMPAILKGWIDRVFVYGRMYKSAMRYDAGICAGKKMIACVTAGASEEACSPSGREGDTHLHLWPILFSFRYVGFDVLVPEIFHGVGGVASIEGHESEMRPTDVYAAHWAQSLQDLSSRPRISYNRDHEFDASKRLKPGAPVYSPFVRHEADDLSKEARGESL